MKEGRKEENVSKFSQFGNVYKHKMIELIHEFGKLSISDVQEKLEKSFGKKIAYKEVHRYVAELEEANLITKNKKTNEQYQPVYLQINPQGFDELAQEIKEKSFFHRVREKLIENRQKK